MKNISNLHVTPQMQCCWSQFFNDIPIPLNIDVFFKAMLGAGQIHIYWHAYWLQVLIFIPLDNTQEMLTGLENQASDSYKIFCKLLDECQSNKLIPRKYRRAIMRMELKTQTQWENISRKLNNIIEGNEWIWSEGTKEYLAEEIPYHVRTEVILEEYNKKYKWQWN